MGRISSKKEGEIMVTGYNLHLDRNASKFQDYIEIGERHLDAQKAHAIRSLKKYVINGMADGTKLEKDWFPEMEADIFISHSHADEKLAKGLAGWLNASFGLHCFIDSCVWGYSDDLLDEINNNYSDRKEQPDGGCIYDYRKGNIASKHVNTMLTIALHKMIDKAEVTILLNTSNSISRYADVYQNATYSPWIYLEIVCTEIVRKKPISEYRKEIFLEHVFEEREVRNDGFSAAYEVSLEHLKDVDLSCLLEWKRLYDNCNIKYPLDYLYKLTHKKETEKIPVNVL